MRDRNDQRTEPVAKCLFALIGILAIAIVIFGVYAARREPVSVRGSQSLPAQAAEQSGLPAQSRAPVK